MKLYNLTRLNYSAPVHFPPQCFLLRKTHMWPTLLHLTLCQTSRPSSLLPCPSNLMTCHLMSRPRQTSPSHRTDPLILHPHRLAAAQRGWASETQSAAATLSTRKRMKMTMRRSCKRIMSLMKRRRRREEEEDCCIYRKASRRRWICWVRKRFQICIKHFL